MEITQTLTAYPNLVDIFRNAGDVLLPRKIYLYKFPEGKDIRSCYESNDFIERELELDGKHSILDMSFLWKNYVNRVCDPDVYSYRYYKDEIGNTYLILVEAIGRNKKFKDGSLPIACKLMGYNCYADVFEELKLPSCF